MPSNTHDLPLAAFVALRRKFLDARGNPIAFALRPKGGTQDDPFDELVVSVLKNDLGGAECLKATGPLINPDLVLARVDASEKADVNRLKEGLDLVVGVEVKKIERTARGGVARPTGLDYNTTPPCGTIRVYQSSGAKLDIRGFYLFVVIEPAGSGGSLFVTGLVLCDGNILNEDFDYYLSIVGEREKEIDLGTYKDGADRRRPMVIFANPLGAPELDGNANLIHPSPDLEKEVDNIKLVYKLRRNVPGNGYRDFYCYRLKEDVDKDWKVQTLIDPFPAPRRRVPRTQARGRFRLPFRVQG